MSATFFLLKDLRTALQDSLSLYPLDSNESYKMANIWIGHTPPKNNIDGDLPSIIIRGLEGEIKEIEGNARVHEVKVGFWCGVYSKGAYINTEAGYNDVHNMIERVIQVLQSKPYWVKRWWLVEPIKWTTDPLSMFNIQSKTHPFYEGVLLATFQSPAIEKPVFTGITDENQPLPK